MIVFDWTKADRYARNFVLNALDEHARKQEQLAVAESPLRFKETAEARGYAFRAAIMKLSREGGAAVEEGPPGAAGDAAVDSHGATAGFSSSAPPLEPRG